MHTGLVLRKKLPRRNWFQRLMYNMYMQINYRLNVIPMRNSRFKYTLRLIIGILIWLLKWAWIIIVKVVKFLNVGITFKKGKNKMSKVYLLTVKGYSFTLSVRKIKSN